MEHGKAACMHHYQYHMVLITMNIDCSCLHSISSKRSALPRCYSVLPYYFYSLFSQSFLWFPERLLYVYFNISLVLPLLINTAVTLLECALLLSFRSEISLPIQFLSKLDVCKFSFTYFFLHFTMHFILM